MSGPMHWGAYDGEFLERLMAVLVAQEEPETMRRQPASGDGGVDLMVPVAGGYEVHQVKGFTGRLGTSERRQIKHSWETILTNPRLDQPIVSYRVVVPIDLTPAEQSWFEELTSDSPWEVTWRGRTHWDSLATRHPHVIDHFVGGGSDRVAERAMALQQSIVDPRAPLAPIDVAGRLADLVSALNSDDPHFRYDLLTSESEPVPEACPSAVMSESRELVDGTVLTLFVSPRHRYALEDSPITANYTIELTDETDNGAFRDAYEGHATFGRELWIPEGALSGTLVAPGGLGGDLEGASGWIGPAVIPEVDPLRLVALDTDGEVVAELRVSSPLATAGPAGGGEFHLVDTAGLLDARLVLHPPDGAGIRRLDFSFHIDDPTGQPIDRVIPTLRLLAALSPANEVQIRPEHGQQVIFQSPIREEAPISNGGLRRLEDLVVLQRYAQAAINVPAEIDPDFAAELRDVVLMLSGQSVTTTWTEHTLSIAEGRTRQDLLEHFGGRAAALRITSDRYVEFDGQTIQFGQFTSIIHSARAAESQPDDSRVLVLVPAEDDRITERAGQPEDGEPIPQPDRALTAPDIDFSD